jgi:hypothetical protein
LRHAGDIAGMTGEAADQTGAHRIAERDHDD